MKYRLRTNNRPGIIRIKVENDTDLIIKGADAENSKRIFFNRPVRIRNKETYSFGIPHASKFIDIEVKQEIPEKDKGFRVNNIVYDKMILKPFYADSLTVEFMKFASIFAYNVCNYPAGKTYTDTKKIFKIKIVPFIKNTPARINIINNQIEVCKQALSNDTVSGINWLLLHEYSHNFLSYDPDCEKEADYYAFMTYLASGYPTIEAFDMLASFSQTEQNEARLEQADELLSEYEKNIYYQK